MNKFKYSVGYKYKNKDRIVEDLTKLGYKKGVCDGEGYIKTYKRIGIGPYGIYAHFDYPLRGNDFEATSEEEFLAIAAIRDDDNYHVGEHFILETDWSSAEKKGTIIKIINTYDNVIEYDYVHRNYSIIPIIDFKRISANGTYVTTIRKMTPEEIIEFYKENNKKMGKNFAVTGPQLLREAFVKTLKEEGFEFDSIMNTHYLEYDYIVLNSTAQCQVGGSKCSNVEHTYILPQDWDKSLEAFRKLKKKQVCFDLPYEEGVMKIEIEQDRFIHQEESNTRIFTIEELRKILNLSGGYIGVSNKMGYPEIVDSYNARVETLSIGCKKGIKIADLQKLLATYEKHFK